MIVVCVIKHLRVSSRKRRGIELKAVTVLCLPIMQCLLSKLSLLKLVFFTDNSVFGVFKRTGKNSVSEQELLTVLVKF